MTSIQIILIIIGWVVVHKLTATRDKDKARREMIVKAVDSLLEDTNKLVSKAWEYHLDERKKRLENEVKMMLQDLSSKTSMLSDISQNNSELAACRSAIIAMKKSITAMHFEDEHIERLDEESPQIQSIASESLRVKQCFIKLKHKQF